MKANEARYGNIIKNGYAIIELDSLGCGVVDMNNMDDIASYIYLEWRNVKPIPLTKEWLLKAGFKKINGWDDAIIWRKSGQGYDFDLEEMENGYEFCDFLTKLEFLHQLQNLYFALCGEELTFKEE